MLVLSAITREYSGPAGPLRVLDDVSLTFDMGDAVAIAGAPTSGKTTLLRIAGGLEAPSSGTVALDGMAPYTLGADARAAFRNRDVGFVFRDPCLLPQLTVLDNVLVPTLVGDPDPDAHDRARVLLTAVGLDTRAQHRPAQLSAGEQQRVALARALVRSPRLLLCDEPTGQLDETTADAIVHLMLRLHARQHTTLIVMTRSPELASRFARRLTLVNGRVEES